MQVEHEDILLCRDNLSKFLLGARGLSEIMSYSLWGADEFLEGRGRRSEPLPGCCQSRLHQLSIPLEAGCESSQLPEHSQTLAALDSKHPSSRTRARMCLQLKGLNKDTLSVVLKTQFWDITSEAWPGDPSVTSPF